MKNKISGILKDFTPGGFGLSGEAYLWEDVKSHLLTRTDIDSEEQLSSELCGAFRTLTGVSIQSGSLVFVGRYNCGGASSGMVDPWNWAAVILPMLVNRFKCLLNA